MRTNTVRKIGLVFLFSLGAFTMVAAILRIISIFVVSTNPSPNPLESEWS